MSGAEGHDYLDSTAAIRKFHASLKSFAFTATSRKPNDQRHASIQDVGRKRRLSSGRPGIELNLKLSTSRRPSPKKKKRGYAAPETYAHLGVLQDILTEGLYGTSSVQVTFQNTSR
jgi:TDG/mug DNA glycosylase family protein